MRPELESKDAVAEGLRLGSIRFGCSVQDRPPNMFGDAQAYERFMGRWSTLVAPRLVDFTGLPERGRVLDVGSGTGSLALAIAKHNGQMQVLGIDPSQEYVAYATSRNPFPERASFEVGDAQQLQFPDASFDAALSLLVFNFIPDPKKALLELHRVTKPGGKLSAAVWDYCAGMRMLRTFWDAAVHIGPDAEKVDEKHMVLCHAGELSALWKQGGLENVHEQSIDILMRFESFADYWEPFLLGQGPAGSYVRRLDRDKLQALRGEVKRRLSLSAENTPIVLPARVWSVCGIVPSRH
jgi:SAM-dependent methyltransferase